VPDMNQKMAVVERSELFQGLDCSICKYMASAALFRDYAYRDVIFVAGDQIKEVLLLAEGRVKLSLFSEEGTEVILRLCLPGEVIYPPAMVPEEMYESTAETLQACRLLAWDARTFNTAQERFPALQTNARCVLERQLQELERRYCEASSRKVSPRLALGLLHLLNRIGRPVNGHFEIDLTQESLAQMTAMNASTVSRVLAKWEKIGIVSLRRGAIVVCDVSGLCDLCKFG
jgi:CRP-like cAMP-binding protein